MKLITPLDILEITGTVILSIPLFMFAGVISLINDHKCSLGHNMQYLRYCFRCKRFDGDWIDKIAFTLSITGYFILTTIIILVALKNN